jgi:hypothetical protein
MPSWLPEARKAVRNEPEAIDGACMAVEQVKVIMFVGVPRPDTVVIAARFR